MFDGVPIFTAAHAKSKVESVECSFEMSGVIDEKRHVRDLLFLAEFTKEQHGELRLPRLKQPNMDELVRIGTDRRQQPVALAVDTDQRFVNRTLIRITVTVGQWVGVLYPGASCRSTAFDTQIFGFLCNILRR